MDIEQLINQARNLMNQPADSPLQDVFDSDVTEYVRENYGTKIVDIMQASLWSGIITYSDEESNYQRKDQLRKAVELLESLKNRPSSPDPKKVEQVKESVMERFGSVVVNGPATFGDNSPISQITTNEFLTALIEEVGKLPDSEEKRSLLGQLQAILNNPTFSNVAGATIGAVIAHLLGARS